MTRSPAITGAEAATIDLRADAAWPAEVQLPLGPWKFRATRGVTHRANSVLTAVGSEDALGGGLDVDALIADAERLYASCGLPAIFQVSTASAPVDLDARLAERGYRLEHPSEVWTARTGDVHAHTAPACVPGLSFVPADAPDGAWLDCALLDDAPVRRAGREGIVRRISRPRLVASIRADGLVVASGLGVSDGGWTGVFLMATRRNWRGRRLATAILHHLAAWAAGRGDAWMYLQVDTDNVAARHLYHRSGFAFAYSYHFRALRRDGPALIPSTVSGPGGDGAGGRRRPAPPS